MTDYPEVFYGPIGECALVWRNQTEMNEHGFDYIEHRCKLDGRHAEGHECRCGAVANFGLNRKPEPIYGTPVVAATGKGKVTHVARGYGKTVCGKFFAQKPGMVPNTTVPAMCDICRPHLSRSKMEALL